MTYEANPVADPASYEPRGDGRFASLTAGLLARKGEAEPALEPFAHARVAVAARQMSPGETHEIDRPCATHAPRGAAPGQAGGAPDADDAPRIRPAPRAPAARRVAADVEAGGFAENCPRERIAKSAKRAAVTFRMSVHDFLRLKLASAELEIQSGDIIVEALESWFYAKGVERLDNCRCLAEAARACAE